MSEVKVEILVNGKPVKQYNHNGNHYIEAREGTEYSIKVKNNDSYGRKLAVITVDGLNVITGEPQKDGVGQGYIVNCCSVIDIKGFRKDTMSVGAFKFCRKSKSYCNSQGLVGNNGVIGVRIFDEKYKSRIEEFFKKANFNPPFTPFKPVDWTYIKGIPNSSEPNRIMDMYSTCDNNTSLLRSCTTSNYSAEIKCSSVTPNFDVGTTWGKQINDSVVYAEFETNESSFVDYIVYYDTRANLENIGISFKVEKQVSGMPKAFGAFATPPKGWRG